MRVYEWRVYAVVNPNAHNVRYGRDCRAPAVCVGTVYASDEAGAQREAENAGFVYNPAMGEYEWLLDHVTSVGPV